jgi:hypothetical protein
MLRGWTLPLLLFGPSTALAHSAEEETTVTIPPLDVQVAGAVRAAPADRREGARVLAYDREGALITGRAGSNDLVCLADDPKRKGFKVACYHRDLEPYMARGRALRAQGVSGEENRKTRWEEIDSGRLPMSKAPRTLYVLTGDGFDPKTGSVTTPYLRWVIYTPHATPESTGLSTEASPSAPWLMFPGTAGAHIMITPPPPE